MTLPGDAAHAAERPRGARRPAPLQDTEDDDSTDFGAGLAEWSETGSFDSEATSGEDSQEDDGSHEHDEYDEAEARGGRGPPPPASPAAPRDHCPRGESRHGREAPRGAADGSPSRRAGRVDAGRGPRRGLPLVGLFAEVGPPSSESSEAGEDEDERDGDGSDDDPLEPIPGEVKLVPSMFPDRSPTVFFEYPRELGIVRCDNVHYSEPLGGRRLLFKTHWERNSVKNAFFRAGFSRTRSTSTWTASWGKHPTREAFRCALRRLASGQAAGDPAETSLMNARIPVRFPLADAELAVTPKSSFFPPTLETEPVERRRDRRGGGAIDPRPPSISRETLPRATG